MHGPTCALWADLTAFAPKAVELFNGCAAATLLALKPCCLPGRRMAEQEPPIVWSVAAHADHWRRPSTPAPPDPRNAIVPRPRCRSALDLHQLRSDDCSGRSQTAKASARGTSISRRSLRRCLQRSLRRSRRPRRRRRRQRQCRTRVWAAAAGRRTGRAATARWPRGASGAISLGSDGTGEDAIE